MKLTNVFAYGLIAMGVGIVGVSQAWLLTNPNPYMQLTDDGEANQVQVVGNDQGAREDRLINVIKAGANWVLGILALIALLFLMWWGFQMVTSGGEDDKYNAWFTILKHAAVGLFLIGLAWFIISIIFWLVNKTTEGGSIAGATTDS